MGWWSKPIIYIITLAIQFIPCQQQTLNIVPLPKYDVNELSLHEFDTIYNDKLPVIIRGSTACPMNLDFTNIHDHCKGGEVPLSFVHTKYQTTSESNNETYWAGLVSGDNEQTIDFGTFVDSMGTSNSEPRFMFDLPMAHFCPSLPSRIHIPPHFVNIFTSQFLWRHLSDVKSKVDDNNSTEWRKYCPRLPFFNMYLAEGGFETDLHIDAMHSAFLASMCVGRKIWRVMSIDNFDRVYEHIGEGGMRGVNGTWVMSSVISPIDTWSPNGLLESLDVDIFEAVLEPNEILYIPKGLPHAAKTLDDSLMVASNDMTLASLQELIDFCNKSTDHYPGQYSAYCKDIKRQYPLIQQNYQRYASKVSNVKQT